MELIKKRAGIIVAAFVLCGSFFVSSALGDEKNDGWKAPASAEKLTNPMKGNDDATKKGEELYGQMCAICHGDDGEGDGMAGGNLNPPPTDFTSDITQKQSDGALFWKLTEGKAPMASYKSMLSEEKRWQLVNYIRSLKK